MIPKLGPMVGTAYDGFGRGEICRGDGASQVRALVERRDWGKNRDHDPRSWTTGRGQPMKDPQAEKRTSGQRRRPALPEATDRTRRMSLGGTVSSRKTGGPVSLSRTVEGGPTPPAEC